MKRRLGILLLALLMTIGVGMPAAMAQDAEMVGNTYLTGYPIVKERETLTIFFCDQGGINGEVDLIPLVQQWEEETNLDLVWEMIPMAAWAERKSIMIASGDWPDIIAGVGGITADEQLQWGEEGILVELDEYIENNMPRFQEILAECPEYLPIIKSANGHIYGFPSASDVDFGMRGGLLYIRGDWLAEAGFDFTIRSEEYYDVIDDAITVDQFADILRAFKEQHPEAIPFSMNGVGGLHDLYGAFGRVDNDNHIVVEDGQVVFTADKDEWKNAVTFFGGLMQEGLIDQELFTDNNSAYLAKLQQENPPLVGASMLWTAHQVDDTMGDVYRNWLLALPLVGPDGTQIWHRAQKNLVLGTFAITAACENPLAAVRFQDYLFEKDNSYQLSLGPYGVLTIQNEDGTIEMLSERLPGHEEEDVMANIMFLQTPEMGNIVNWAGPTQMTIDVGMEYRAYQPEESQAYPNIQMVREDQDRLVTLRTDIKSIVDGYEAMWLTEGGIDDTWDAYLAELQAAGLPEMLDILQRNYDLIVGE